MLSPNQCYREACEIPGDLFGQKHVVARPLLNSLLSAMIPNIDDAELRTKLAITIQSCEVTLPQPEYDVDLNSTERITSVLLRPLQPQWAGLVDEACETSDKRRSS
ncbi:hypothetical protein FGIG_00827 [Fasciola gigantica]|uniref:Uncharacterized protein n=1 Tax=Fasciola gigantica TaxID=46835 RepID=A0A504YIK3_FASGI|nr:hypothetical protein FGIG_00827 [Fasciola gigantica]